MISDFVGGLLWCIAKIRFIQIFDIDHLIIADAVPTLRRGGGDINPRLAKLGARRLIRAV